MADAQDDPQDFQDVAIDDNFNENRMAHLSDIIAQAMLKYSVKDYDTAAELYSQATELQAEINGEMSPQNADLLYAYGRCLYHVAVKKSDVLGSKVAGESQEGRKKSSKKLKSERASGTRDGHELRGAEETVSKVVKEKDELVKPEEESEKSNKPYFQFTGDQNWDSSEEEDHSNSGEEDGEEIDEEDDFINAYEVLDLARVLLLKKLEDVKGTPSKGAGVSQGTRQLEERLADTYDLQAEISLEGERFSNAVVDLKAALRLKSVLFPQESSLLAEAHYKLSLALEFSSVTQPKESNGTTETGKDAQIDEDMRREATSEMEAAIASCTLRIQKEESVVSEAALGFGDNAKIEVTKSDIAEVKEMVKEMEQRLAELRQTPVSLSNPNGLETLESSNPLSGILGSILGESPAAQAARLENASKDARDLTSLVKKKRSAHNERPRSFGSGAGQTNGKRKGEFAEKIEEVGIGKRAKNSTHNND